MSIKYDVFPGARIGRWTVLEQDGREKRWKCRCDCGEVRVVSDRGLRYGGSFSCGCLRRERAYAANAHNLAGKKFGKLSVIEKTDNAGQNGCRWKCRCECGCELVIPATLLVTGKKTSCGCDVKKNYAFADISGRKFHRLTALYPLDERTAKGGLIWHCRCECGNELDIPYNTLLYSNIRSCGCRKREHDMLLKELLPHVDGTSICHLQSKKTPKNNTTGVKGVYLIKGRYVAKIVFQKKQYMLGSYDRIEEAAEARREAEEVLNDQVTAFYKLWKQKADADQIWAENNPISIHVENKNGNLRVEMLPRII